LEKTVRTILRKHRKSNQVNEETSLSEREQRQVETLRKASRKIKRLLDQNEERKSVSGKAIKSNITDNESSKMKTSHGVLQSYIGVAAADSESQVIVAAEIYGQAQEHGLLEPMCETAHFNLKSNEKEKQKTKITADSGFCNRKALEYLKAEKIEAYIADTGFRSRDPRSKTAEAHKPKDRFEEKKLFTQEDFEIDLDKETCQCPAGKSMWLKCNKAKIKEFYFMQFQAFEKDCPNCSLKSKCLKNEKQTTPRQVNVKLGKTKESKTSVNEKMKQKIDSDEGRAIYSLRLGTVEPVFGNITEMLGFKRFSLGGQKKVDGQWKLITMVHNILKIHRYGRQW